MTQHTPGPWEIRKAKDGSGDIAIVAPNAPANQDGKPGILGECYADIRRRGENNTAEAEANSHLIAAAPTMFAYIEQKASEGDAAATSIIGGINGNA